MIKEKECSTCKKVRVIGYFPYKKKISDFSPVCCVCLSDKESFSLQCSMCGLVKKGKYYLASMIYENDECVCQNCRHGKYRDQYKKLNIKDGERERLCLSCDRYFVSKNRFNRVCSDCKKRDVFN